MTTGRINQVTFFVWPSNSWS